MRLGDEVVDVRSSTRSAAVQTRHAASTVTQYPTSSPSGVPSGAQVPELAAVPQQADCPKHIGPWPVTNLIDSGFFKVRCATSLSDHFPSNRAMRSNLPTLHGTFGRHNKGRLHVFVRARQREWGREPRPPSRAHGPGRSSHQLHPESRHERERAQNLV